MKYVQINTVPNGSTGAVMFREQEKRLAIGDECWAMWGRGRAAENDHELNFGSKLGFYTDVALTRLDDRAGFHSKAATRRLLAKLDEIDPDIVHLHNLHGYYVNIEMLFRWLEKRGQKTYWTLHDCWSFTGHCSYFTYVKCEQWKNHCSHQFKCPQKKEYPKSCLLDSSKRNFDDKRRIFTSLPADKLRIITPSHWLAGLVAQSFLSKYPAEVHHNEVDKTVFKPTPSDFRERYGIGDRFMILGVASPWTKRKGLDDFVRLSKGLDDSYAVVLIGLSKKQIKQIDNRIIALPKTDTVQMLVEAYTAADVYVQPSSEETFGMTVAEAQACGTSVVVMKGSACEEIAREELAFVSDLGFDALKATVKKTRESRL